MAHQSVLSAYAYNDGLNYLFLLAYLSGVDEYLPYLPRSNSTWEYVIARQK